MAPRSACFQFCLLQILYVCTFQPVRFAVHSSKWSMFLKFAATLFLPQFLPFFFHFSLTTAWQTYNLSIPTLFVCTSNWIGESMMNAFFFTLCIYVSSPVKKISSNACNNVCKFFCNMKRVDNSYFGNFWKRNFPMASHVRTLVCTDVGWLVCLLTEHSI